MRSRVVALAGCVGALVMAPEAVAQSKGCSNIKGAEVIGVENLTCRSGQKVARGWVTGYKRDGRLNRSVFSFRCRNRPSEVEGTTIYCRKGRSLVRFYPNVRR